MTSVRRSSSRFNARVRVSNLLLARVDAPPTRLCSSKQNSSSRTHDYKHGVKLGTVNFPKIDNSGHHHYFFKHALHSIETLTRLVTSILIHPIPTPTILKLSAKMSRELISSAKFPPKPHNCKCSHEEAIIMSMHSRNLWLTLVQALPLRYLALSFALGRPLLARLSRPRFVFYLYPIYF